MFVGTNFRQSWIDAMKSILLPVDQNEQMPSAFETARLAANLFDSTVEGVALRLPFAALVGPDFAIAMPPDHWDETEFCETAREAFDDYAEQHSAEQNKGARFRWRGGLSIQDLRSSKAGGPC